MKSSLAKARGWQIHVALILALLLGACTAVAPEQRSENDPWEPVNRTIFDINTAIDKVTLKPVARGYDKVVPRPVKIGVSNFMSNLATPGSAVNNVLQGKLTGGFTEMTRFLLNSILGIGGLFDVARASGIEPRPEDFGQTAAVWGAPPGPYVMLPFRGPTTLRDALMMPFDIAADPLYHYDVSSVRDKLVVLRIIDVRARLLVADKLLDDSKDRYVTVRESYLQNREYQVYDGNPPEDDEFFDEFLDDE
ncbi:MAG: VacJ family lipoprotein [Gammaproteobacteria bacterium]|nr:VacJ family lipoprotein [Gammaproteobacteria bacterium]